VPILAPTDAVVILDVLHYMKKEEQLQVLKRVRTALPGTACC